jgi:hypothetical protein
MNVEGHARYTHCIPGWFSASGLRGPWDVAACQCMDTIIAIEATGADVHTRVCVCSHSKTTFYTCSMRSLHKMHEEDAYRGCCDCPNVSSLERRIEFDDIWYYNIQSHGAGLIFVYIRPSLH